VRLPVRSPGVVLSLPLDTSPLFDPPEGSICRDVPRPDASASAGARNAGQGKRAATRTHAQRRLRREHGEDGEHWTLTAVSTLAPCLLARRIMNMPFDGRVPDWDPGPLGLPAFIIARRYS